MACRAADQKMADLFTGEVSAHERLEIEAHAARCVSCGDTLRDLATISIALDRAYAPLRRRTTQLSAARVRLAVRGTTAPPAGAAPWWRFGLVGRLSEATMALAFGALVLGGTADIVRHEAPPATPPSIVADYLRTMPPADEQGYIRWLNFQLKAIGADVGPAVRYPAGGRFDVAPPLLIDDWLGPR